MKNIKRFLSLAVALAMVCVFSIGVFAENASTEPVLEDMTSTVTAPAQGDSVSRASLGDIIATNATTIYGGSGTLTVTLNSGNFWADLVAGIGYTDQNCVVTCSVRDPNGNSYNLGSIAGSGSRTHSYELGYAPAGDYVFYFSSATSTPMDVVAYIYD